MNRMPSNNELDSLLDIITLAEETGLSETDYFIAEVEKLSKRWDNYRYQKLLQACLKVKSFPSLLKPVFRTPVVQDEISTLQGDFNIGHIIGTGIKVGLKKIALGLHTLISGATGFGKTNSMNALSESVRREETIIEWKIDPKTGMGDFRHQIIKYPNIVLILLSMLKLNPFGPIRGVPRKIIMERVIEVLSDSWSVYDASQGVIAEHVERTFEREKHPCFMDVADSILSDKAAKFGRRQGYLDTLEVRIKNTMLSLREAFDCREDYFNYLFDKNVIFEVGGISEFAQKVLVPFIIMKLSLFKTYNPSKQLSHLLYFEEAQGAIFSKILEQRGRTPTVATLATQARSYGMGVIVLCQNPVTKIITEMLSNSANLICFHVGGTEVKGMAECMGLTHDQASSLQHLQPGEAIFKTSLGYTEPVLVKVREINNTPPSDEDVEKLMQPKWDELLSHVTPVEKKTEVVIGKKKETPKEHFVQPSERSFSENTEQKEKSELKPDDEILLKDVQLRPYEYTENRYQQSTLSRSRAIKAKARLCRLGLLEEVRFKTGKRGKPSGILRLTEKAVSYLGINSSIGKGGLEHVWYQQLVIHLAKANGLKAKIEDMGADVSLLNGNIDVAVEITLNDSNVLQNVERDFQKGYSEVWLAVKNKAMRTKVNEQLSARILKPGTIKVILLEEIVLEIRKFCSER